MRVARGKSDIKQLCNGPGELARRPLVLQHDLTENGALSLWSDGFKGDILAAPSFVNKTVAVAPTLRHQKILKQGKVAALAEIGEQGAVLMENFHKSLLFGDWVKFIFFFGEYVNDKYNGASYGG